MLDLSGSSGARIGGRTSSGPSSFGVQSGMCMPSGTEKKAIRRGGPPSAACASRGMIDSNHGKAITVPMPRRTVRRETLEGLVMVHSFISRSRLPSGTNGRRIQAVAWDQIA